jgi:hypothetical protein
MSMSDPFLPIPPEEISDGDALQQDEDLEEDRGPDVLPGIGEDDDERAEAAAADQPDRFRTPQPGARLTAAELEAELD